jgi:hypothetical protein
MLEGPVPLSDVGPPAVPFCARATVPDNANAVASAIDATFMVIPFRGEKIPLLGNLSGSAAPINLRTRVMKR